MPLEANWRNAPTDGYYEPPEENDVSCYQCKHCVPADNLQTFWYCKLQQENLRSDSKCKTDIDIFNSFYAAEKDEESPLCSNFSEEE